MTGGALKANSYRVQVFPEIRKWYVPMKLLGKLTWGKVRKQYLLKVKILLEFLLVGKTK